jgi:hypothetical protein
VSPRFRHTLSKKEHPNEKRLVDQQAAIVTSAFLALAIRSRPFTYRGFQFGVSLSAAVKHSGMDVSEVTVIHERPARIQELSWRPVRFSSSDTAPVEQVLFSFYNGQLFRMVVDYDNQKTEGLSVHDITRRSRSDAELLCVQRQRLRFHQHPSAKA